MRILHLCNKVPFPGRDGSSLAMEALIRIEASLGHEVQVVALNTDKHWVPNPSSPIAGASLEAIDLKTAPRWNTAMANLFDRQSYYASRFWSAEAAKLIERLAADCDLVVFDSLFMAVYLPHIGDKPSVLRAHNVEHSIWQRGLSEEPILRRLYVSLQAKRLKRWEQEVSAQVSRIWTISNEDELWFAQVRPGAVQCLPCSVDFVHGSWEQSGASPAAAYHLGAMDWTPNIRGMQWFIDEVAPKLKNAELEVFSKHWPFEGSTGSVKHQTHDLDFQKFGVFVAPIRSGSGMRIKLLEAMARGKAIVTTSLGAEGLKAQHDVHLLIADSSEDFAAALDLLCSDLELRSRIGNAAAAHARQTFSDETVALQLRTELATFSH
ncbi:MAG: glycosyltransferase [Cryomorphaceae bacterium]|nr:glycosyltransferase [Cryomorphaceae bacterium]